MENKQTPEKLTAMEQLINWIDSDCSPMDCVMKAKELLAMEKEQIEEGYLQGMFARHIMRGEAQANKYYNETYKQQDNNE